MNNINNHRNSCLEQPKTQWSKHEFVDEQFSKEMREMLRRKNNMNNSLNRDLDFGFRRATKAMRSMNKTENFNWGWKEILDRLEMAEWEDDRWKS